MSKCEICGNEFKNLNGLTKHIRQRHNMKMVDYYNKYLKKNEKDGICKLCGKPTKYLSLKYGYKDFCSRKCSANSETKKQKIKKTNLEKYGVENPLQVNKIKEKVKQTNLEKYGCEYTFQNEEIKEKIKNTLLNRYGVENASQNEEIKIKKQKTLLKNYGVINLCELVNTTSNIELDLLNWIKSLNVVTNNSRWFSKEETIYELDIYLPDFNIGIEMDGYYYHSIEKKEEKYHLNKTNWFKENFDIDVIHIVDLEWLDYENRKEIENIIKYKLSKEKLKENRYINNNVYDRRFFNNLDGEYLEPKLLDFKTMKYENCGYVKL